MSGCDCSDEPLMPLEVALQRMLERLPAPMNCEAVALGAARGRVLAQTLYAPGDMQPWDNSAMDGYALRAADWQSGTGLPLHG